MIKVQGVLWHSREVPAGAELDRVLARVEVRLGVRPTHVVVPPDYEGRRLGRLYVASKHMPKHHWLIGTRIA